jgi:hypothetical protein
MWSIFTSLLMIFIFSIVVSSLVDVETNILINLARLSQDTRLIGFLGYGGLAIHDSIQTNPVQSLVI